MKWLLMIAAIASYGLETASAQNPSIAKAAGNSMTCSKPTFPGHAWKHSSNDHLQAWSLPKLAAARQYADSVHDSSFLVVQCGRVVDEWGETGKKITTFSVRKSLISALYGIYSAEGKIDVNETLEQAGIDDSPSPLTKEERHARIVDLLRARSGVYHAAAFETDYQRNHRPARGSHAPGSFWFYNNWDFNVLGTIFEKKTGLKIGDAFYQRIARPTGMQDFQPGDVYYLGDASVSMHPGFMFEMTARDMARFGLLYLNHGRWNKQQVIPEAWVEKSSHATEMVHVGETNVGGYEYLWWVEYGGVHLLEGTLPGMYSAQGAGGHMILVVPSLKVVIVNQFNNEPAMRDPDSVKRAAQSRQAISDVQLDHIVKLILDAVDG
jgi:CubicO group peptidase (beta-lactamase class C family)